MSRSISKTSIRMRLVAATAVDCPKGQRLLDLALRN